ncbi:MAG: nuclear transport factor 2 family protein [Solirubrobacterales bacterium]
MPWVPELFSAPVVAQLEDRRRRDERVTVPYFAGFLTGETDALIQSFTGEPEVHYPVRGRVKGERAFAAYAAATKAWLVEREASIEDVGILRTERRSIGEAVLHLGGEEGRVDLPVAIVADQRSDGWIEEVRIYYSNWALAGRHANRPPVLQPDPELREPDVVGDYQRALAAGDLDAILASFESGGYAREPAGADYVHRGPEGLREFYEWSFSNGGGIALEHCSVTDDGRACALEYNVVRWGRTGLAPEAGIAVYVRGESGKLAAARIYDDADPPLGAAR